MATDRIHEIIEGQTADAEDLLANVRRAAQGDVSKWADAINAASAALDAADTLMRSVVNGARQDGTTWEQIGKLLGTTRQAAHERFG